MATARIPHALFAVLSLTAASFAQTAPAPPPCPPAGQTQNPAQPCTPPPAVSPADAAKEHPFPGSPQSHPAGSPDAPAPSSGSVSPSDAAKEHPFPTAPAPRLPGDDSSSSSSSSSSSGGGADDDTTDMPKPGEVGSSVHRKLPKPQHIQSDDERVDEDLRVAKFYLNDENFQGAYMRAKDAVKTQPDYSDTHFTLARAAQKMKKRDEAIAEFEAYLKLDPDGPNSRAAKKALEELK